MSLSLALEAVWFQLMRVESPLVSRLQPGLSRARIEAMVRPFPFELPEELYQLYMWRNGTEANCDAPSLFAHPAGYFAPLESALRASADLSEYLTNSPLKEMWEPLEFEASAYYFDLFSDLGDSDFLVPCGPPVRDKPPIVFWSPELGAPRIHYQDLESMMWTIAACYESGAYFLSNAFENEPLDVDADDTAARRVARQLNPTVSYWQEDALSGGI